jgi:hypothetical protein
LVLPVELVLVDGCGVVVTAVPWKPPEPPALPV